MYLITFISGLGLALLSVLDFAPIISSFVHPISRLSGVLFWFHIFFLTLSSLYIAYRLLVSRVSVSLKPFFLVLNLICICLYIYRFRGARASYLHFEESPLEIGTLSTVHKPFALVENSHVDSFRKTLYAQPVSPELTLLSHIPFLEDSRCNSSFNHVPSFCAEFVVNGEPVLFIYTELFVKGGGWSYYEKQAHLRRLTSLSRYFERGGVVLVVKTDISPFSRFYNRISYQGNVGGTLSLLEAFKDAFGPSSSFLVFNRRPNIPPDMCEIAEL
jgi:hypothetical protein